MPVRAVGPSIGAMVRPEPGGTGLRSVKHTRPSLRRPVVVLAGCEVSFRSFGQATGSRSQNTKVKHPLVYEPFVGKERHWQVTHWGSLLVQGSHSHGEGGGTEGGKGSSRGQATL